MKIILGGHWDNPPEGWIALTEQQQDITKRLQWEDNSVDCIFTEHVQEHITLIENISFLKEVLRVLKPGGILRVAMPCLDKMIQLGDSLIDKHYSDVQTRHYYPNEDTALKEIGLQGIREEPIAFMMDSLFKGHNHKFIWTSWLFKSVCQKLGFSETHVCQPGDTVFDSSNNLERIIRGVDPEYISKLGIYYYDPETMVIEAKK